MWTEIVLFCGAALAIHWLQWKGYFSKMRLPPSIYGFPLLGVVPYLFWIPNHVALVQRTVKKHGSVFRFRLALTDAVIVNGPDAVKEALKNDDLLGRPPLGIFTTLKKLMKVQPFTMMERDKWRQIRNSSVQGLRELGFGKTPVMEGQVQEELKAFLDALSKQKGSSYNPRSYLLTSVSNAMAALVFGQRLPYEHPNRRDLNSFLLGFVNSGPLLTLLGTIPGLANYMDKLRFKAISELVDNAQKASAVFEQVAETKEHEQNYNEDDKRDFMDHMISEQKKRPDLYTPPVTRGSCVAFFGAGSNTSRITLEYLMQLAAVHPELQDRMYKEVIREVGESRLPQWSDSSKLHLINAFIAERHRIFSVVPFGVFRRALRDTKIQGFDIPAGTTVIYNVDSVHMDPNEFKNPDEFRPERFLDAEGKFVPSKNVIPFAIGKRACPGESFAMFQVFLYFAAIMQRFRIEPSEKGAVKLSTPTQFFSEPISQELRFISRT